MKKSRRILMLVLALVMVFTVVAVPASAAETLPADEPVTIEPRAEACSCGGSYINVTEWGSWYFTGSTQPCTHGYRFGDDKIYRRDGIRYKRCNRCGEGWMTGTTYQTDTYGPNVEYYFGHN